MNMLPPETVLGAFRYLHSLFRRKQLEVAGSCLQCGKCCESLCISLDGGFIESEYQFQEACAKDPRYERFVITGQDSFGPLVFKCSRLVANRCADYGNRLEFCINYPTTNLYFTGRNVLPGCGFRFSYE
jgi:Fe-S-cluster containining protein